MAERSDATLPELRERLRERAHLAVSQATMSRALKRLGLTRKKTLYAAERDREDVVQARAQYRTDPLWQKPQTLIFFDESGVNLSFTRAHARAPRGHRAVGSVPKNWGDNVTLSGGLSTRGSTELR